MVSWDERADDLLLVARLMSRLQLAVPLASVVPEQYEVVVL
jgi:hypothetical protein